MTTPATQPLLTDRDGRPVSQYWNPRTLAYEAAQGEQGGLLVRTVNTSFADTSTVLGANAIFTGVTRDFGAVQCTNRFRAASTSAQTGTLFVEQSNDGTNWVMTHAAATASVTDANAVARHIARIDAEVVNRFARVRYRNGATLQTEFRLISMQTGV